MSDGFRPVSHDLPYAERRFRHRESGELALLSVGLAHAPGGVFHRVEVARPDHSPVPDVMFSTWARHIERAREVWRERERELRAAGYERVPDQQSPAATIIPDTTT